MARTTILLDDDLLLRVKHLAKTNGLTITDVVREALEALVKKQRPARLPSFTGVGKSGRRSISKNAEAILRNKINRKEGW